MEEIAGVVQIIHQERFSKCFIVRIVNDSSGDATSDTDHPDLEDIEGSTSAVP